MNCLITGATGFIGGRLAEELRSSGTGVIAYCRPGSDTRLLESAGVKVFRGELDSPGDLAAAMKECDRAYHLAAFAGNWSRNSSAVRQINCQALDTLLEVASHHQVRRVVYTSTVMTYGPSNGHPVTEETLRSSTVRTQYEDSKMAAERIVDSWVRKGLDIVTVHPSRVFGPGRLSESNAVTSIISQYLDGSWRGMPGNGSPIGNYVYVEDVVRGCVAAMEHGIAGSHYILGGANLTFSEFFSLVAEISGTRRSLFPIPRVVAKAFAGGLLGLGKLGVLQPPLTPAWVDIFYGDWQCSSKLAIDELGYEPTPIEEALAATIRWLRDGTPPREASS